MAEEVKYDKNKIIAGDVVFELEGFSLKNRWNWFWNKEELSDKYRDMAIELMNWHYEFYGQFLDKDIEEYVTNGAMVRCSNAVNDLCTGLCNVIGHGVISSNKQEVLTCKDCTTREEFLGDFGTCKIDHSTYKIPELGESAWVGNPYKCFPVLEKKWRQQGSDLAIAVDVKGEEFVDALRSSAYLVCMYGGKITVIDIPEKPEEETKDKEEALEEEELKKGKLDRRTVKLAPWLYGYPGMPTRDGGRMVDLKKEDRAKYEKVDWYAYMKGINNEVENQYREAGKQNEYNVSEDDRGALVNSARDDRYWIAVGPVVLCEDYNSKPPEEQTLTADQFEYGTEINVVLENPSAENPDERIIYIECIVGELKGNTYPNGVFQSGKPHPFSSNTSDDTQKLIEKAIDDVNATDTDTVADVMAVITGEKNADETLKNNEAVMDAADAYAKEITNSDGSYIEFLGGKKENGDMSDYSVKEIIVYDREW